MGSGRPLEGGNQMQRKHERFLEEDQLQVGVWVPQAVYGAAKLKVSASPGPSVFAPPAPARCCPLRCCVLLLPEWPGILCHGLKRGTGSWRLWRVGHGHPGKRGRLAPHFRSLTPGGESRSVSLVTPMPRHRPSGRGRGGGEKQVPPPARSLLGTEL